MPFNEEQIAEYWDYENNTLPEDYTCPYCGSPSPDVHLSDCATLEFGDNYA